MAEETVQSLLLELRNNINNPIKNAKNAFFKNSYANLGEVLSVLNEALPKGLNFVQPTKVLDNGATILQLEFFTKTDKKVVSELPVVEVDGGKTNRLQMFGQSLTYMRRYQLTTYLGLNAEDNDGNTQQQQRGQGNKQQSQPQQNIQQTPQEQDKSTKLLVDQLVMKTKELAKLRGTEPDEYLNRIGNLSKLNAQTANSFLMGVNRNIEEEKAKGTK